MILLPTLALGADQTPARLAEEPIYYLFEASVLDYPDQVSARFEVRSADRVLAVEKLLVSFGGAEALLVPIPRLLHGWSPEGEASQLRVLVFANGLLLDVFDRSSLLAYNRVLRYTRNEEVAFLDAGTGVGASTPGLLTRIYCQSPCEGGCGPYDDYDCDGVINMTDNCTDDYNPGQQNCDGDAWGDACDGTNGVFQPSGPVDTCMTDKDNHIVYITFEHHVEQRLVDVSSCNAPDRWNRWVRMDNDCVNISDFNCCWGLRTSISAVGDDPNAWCSAGIRDIDFCH